MPKKSLSALEVYPETFPPLKTEQLKMNSPCLIILTEGVKEGGRERKKTYPRRRSKEYSVSYVHMCMELNEHQGFPEPLYNSVIWEEKCYWQETASKTALAFIKSTHTNSKASQKSCTKAGHVYVDGSLYISINQV